MRSLALLLPLVALSLAGCDQHGGKTKKGEKTAEPTEPAFVPKGAGGGGGGGGDEDESDPKSLNGKKLVADLGFRPKPDGFSFPNFTLQDPDDLRLGPKDLRKMCGDKAVCSSDSDEDECTLKAGAQAFLDASARLLRGGHCEGFSVGSLRLYMKEDEVDKLGEDQTFGLDRKKKVERYLAYWAVTQMSPSVAHATYRAAPNKVLDKLIRSMKKKNEAYVLGIHRADGKGGHAIVPYAVEDRGDDVYWVYVYENNSPSRLRHVEFDKGKNTWRYDDAATSPEDTPSVYSGSAAFPRIELIPQSSRNDMACPFAAGSSDDADDEDDQPKPKKKKKKPVVEEEDDEPKVAEVEVDEDDDVMLVGRGAAALSVEDDAGHTLGIKNGELVNEIPGATYAIPRGKIASDMPPILFFPAKTKVKLSVRGKDGDKNDVAIIGKKFAAQLTGIESSSKPADPIEIDGKKKQLVFVSAPVAQKIELFVDKGKTVQKLEIPKLEVTSGNKLKLDGKAGKLQLEGKGIIKPIAAPLTPVVKPIATPKLDGPVVVKPAPAEPAKPITGPALKPADPAKPAEPAKPITGPALKPAAPAEPGKPLAPKGLIKPKVGGS